MGEFKISGSLSQTSVTGDVKSLAPRITGEAALGLPPVGVTAYPDLSDKPKVNGVELVGDKSLLDLGIEPKRGPEDNYVSTAEKAALHTHANKGILDYITGPLVATWNSAVSWVNEVGAAHVINYLNPHKTSFANIEGYPATPSGKYLKDDGTFAVMPSGGGGSGSPLYLSNVNSDIPGYKKLSYTPDAVEVIKTITANNSTVYGETYIFDLPIDLSVINAGQWVFDYWRSVSNAALESYAKIESFLRHSDGTETTTYSVESPSIEDTALTQRIITYTLQQFAALPTDRFGIRMSFRTTRNANTVYSYVVGGLRGHSIISPVPPRHDYLRDKDGNPAFQHISATEKSKLDRLLVDFTVPSNTAGLTFDRDKNGTLMSALFLKSVTIEGMLLTDISAANGSERLSINGDNTNTYSSVPSVIGGFRFGVYKLLEFRVHLSIVDNYCVLNGLGQGSQITTITNTNALSTSFFGGIKTGATAVNSVKFERHNNTFNFLAGSTVKIYRND